MQQVRHRILCVDDEVKNLKLLEALLVPEGYEMIEAKDGKEALSKIRKDRIDLILLDVMMPEMDGFELCKEIKGNKKYRNIPVVMITALTAKADRIKGIEAGAEEFLSKPFDQGEVIARVKMLLRVKDLNDKLNSSYNNINRLTDFGEDIIKTFNPLEFDFMSKIDGIVGQLIRQTSDMTDRPETVLVRIPNEKQNYEWYRYEFIFDKLDRLKFEMNILLKLPKADDSRLLFYNEAVMSGPMFEAFTGKLRAYNISAKNMVCYMSNNLSVFALNYGRDVTSYDAAVLNNIVMQTLFLRSLSSQVKETENAFEYMVHALARASEANDEDTGNHILRIGFYSAVIAKKLGMNDGFAETIKLQSQMHDVGKIHTPAEILKKPGKLTNEEWKIMKMHTERGGAILGSHIRLKTAKAIALTHHERWDGSGYPRGLSGEQIPIEGRIISIADQYDALRNARVYKPAFDHDKAHRIIEEGDGRTIPAHFDPRVLTAYKELSGRFEEIYEKLKN
ncbi:MAG: response regulator [Nitrospirae bacterium]|nr:MAG: response regulator [Nitrospirota bacterium]